MMNEILNQFILGDCIEVMKSIQDCSISTCITDPPYNYEFVGKDWSDEEINRRLKNVNKQNSKTLVKHIPYGSGLAGGVRNENWYKRNRDNILSYRNWVKLWAEELFRILKPGGYALIFNSTRTAAHIQVAFEDVGFYARDTIVWRRASGIPKGLNIEKKLEKIGYENSALWSGWHSALRNEWEAITLVQKPLVNNYINTLMKYNVGLLHTKSELINGFQSNILENIPREPKDKFNTHSTVKPIALIERLILLTTPKFDENIIIDAFMGSGTTALAASKLGYNWIGIEKDLSYIEIAKQRLALANHCKS